MFFEYVKSAIFSIRSNKVRAFLTMLGIIIGISAVLVVLIIGDGMKERVNSEMDSIGATTVTVYLDDTKTDKVFSKDQLDDVEREIDDIYGISPQLQSGGEFISRETFDAFVTGVSQATESGSITMVHGRYISRTDVEDAKDVIVLSQTAAKKLFGYEEVVGQIVTLNSFNMIAELQVVGIREDNTMDTSYASFLEEPTLLGEIPTPPWLICTAMTLIILSTVLLSIWIKRTRMRFWERPELSLKTSLESVGRMLLRYHRDMALMRQQTRS